MFKSPAPFFPWMGGKRRLAKHLLPLFPKHTCYVEPFCGAAALFFLRDTPAKKEVINDINGEIVNLFRVVQAHPEEFFRQFEWSLPARQQFDWLKCDANGIVGGGYGHPAGGSAFLYSEPLLRRARHCANFWRQYDVQGLRFSSSRGNAGGGAPAAC